jgi:hypothetical protein
MAHFTKINLDNIVEQVIVVNNSVLLDENGIEKESKGIEFLNSLFGYANWVQTSYNGNFRKQYAGVGYTYDSTKDKFIAPQPFNSWTLDSDDNWQPPTPRPTDESIYFWNEETLSWDSI